MKQGLKKVTQYTLTTRVAKALFTYRLTPQGTTGIYLAELLLGRRPQSKLDLMRPNTAKCVEHRHLQPKTPHGVRLDAHKLQEGEEVYLRNFGKEETWLPGWIVKCTSSGSFLICGHHGRTLRQHQNHLQPRQCIEVPGTDQSPRKLPADDSTLQTIPNDLSLLQGSLLGSESMKDIDSQVPQLVASLDIGIQASQSDVSPESSIPAMCPAASSQQRYPRGASTAPNRYRPRLIWLLWPYTLSTSKVWQRSATFWGSWCCCECCISLSVELTTMVFQIMWSRGYFITDGWGRTMRELPTACLTKGTKVTKVGEPLAESVSILYLCLYINSSTFSTMYRNLHELALIQPSCHQVDIFPFPTSTYTQSMCHPSSVILQM